MPKAILFGSAIEYDKNSRGSTYWIFPYKYYFYKKINNFHIYDYLVAKSQNSPGFTIFGPIDIKMSVLEYIKFYFKYKQQLEKAIMQWKEPDL